MLTRDLLSALDALAPPEYAEPWDNVGLLIGAGDRDVTTALLTIDLTAPVLQEAIRLGAQLVVAYHPPIFEPLTSLTDRTPRERIALAAAEAGIAVYSPHTALDAAPGGVNDWLAAGLGDGDVRALRSHETLPTTEQCKLVTFCPAEAVGTLRKALAAVGAGRIGRYQLCSFEITGHGTFLGEEGTAPAVGAAGSLQRIEETRLEMVCPASTLGLLAATLREFHPYEEPPIEIYPLRARPDRSIGAGRRVVLDQAVALTTLAARIKEALGVEQLRVALGRDAPGELRTIGLCAGAGGALLEAAADQGCEVFLTGEMRHHDVLAAQTRGCTVVLAGHTNTERGYLGVLRERLQKELDGVAIEVSREDVDPLEVM